MSRCTYSYRISDSFECNQRGQKNSVPAVVLFSMRQIEKDLHCVSGVDGFEGHCAPPNEDWQEVAQSWVWLNTFLESDSVW